MFGAFAKSCKEAAVLEIPYLIPISPIAWEVLDGELAKALSQHCLKRKWVTHPSVLAKTGFRNFTNSKRPVAEPKT